MAKKKAAAWGGFREAMEEFTKQLSPRYWVEQLEAAAVDILSKYTVVADVLPIKKNGSLTKKTFTSDKAPAFQLPKEWPAGTKPKDIAKAEAARELMWELRQLKRLLDDPSDKARDVAIACAVVVGIRAEAMRLGHVVTAAQASSVAMQNGKAEAHKKRLQEFGELYAQVKTEFPNRTDSTYFQKVNEKRLAAGLETFSTPSMNDYKKLLGLSNRRKQ